MDAFDYYDEYQDWETYERENDKMTKEERLSCIEFAKRDLKKIIEVLMELEIDIYLNDECFIDVVARMSCALCHKGNCDKCLKEKK